MIRLD